MTRKIDAVGRQSGRLLCLEEAGKSVICGCACGSTVTLLRGNFLACYTQSCGCLQKQRASEASTTHGFSGTAMYNAWKIMRKRCSDPAHENYKHYGGRGIKVCARWEEFANFLADMGERPEGMELDRKDNDRDYEPGNCRWVSHKDNCNNR